MKIMFMGTPEISAICLRELIASDNEIVAVVTGKDKPRGRGNVMTPTAVKALALEHSLPVYTPDSLKGEDFSELLNEINPDLIAVVAYGKILPKNVLDFPKFGCINVHVSLLPKYRGAAPMQRAIIDGESETGVTIMHMAEGVDTGDIITTEAFAIGPEDDFEAIHDRSAEVGAKLLVKTITDLANGTATRTPQDDALATHAAKIEKEDCKIDWSWDGERIVNFVRGLSPYPAAWSAMYLNSEEKGSAKIFHASFSEKEHSEAAGTIRTDGKGSLEVACANGWIAIHELQVAGKRRMATRDLLLGFRNIEDYTM